MNECILLLGHGSPKQDANTLDRMAPLLHTMVHPGCRGHCVTVAYLQFAEPGIRDAISDCVSRGARKVVLQPFFLSAGVHVTRDIPELIEEARERYPHVTFVSAEPLGIHEKLAQIAMERISAAEPLAPAAIEARSFALLSAETDLSTIPPDRLPIVQRVIHATADFDFKETLTFHPDAIAAGRAAITAGRDILTDVEMVRSGINTKLLSRWGGRVLCRIAEAEGQKSDVTTRAERGIASALRECDTIGIVAVGNAPTALLKVIELLTSPLFANRPLPLVIGVPVGFVKAAESKALLAAQSFPFITARGRKGGSSVAVAIVNALLTMTTEEA